MKKINSKRFMVIAFGLLLGLTQSALAQNSTTTITGHVKDPEGANLPGATVTLYGRERTFSLTTTTDSTGTYRFERLAPGEYLVEAEEEGFASANAQQVVVERSCPSRTAPSRKLIRELAAEIAVCKQECLDLT